MIVSCKEVFTKLKKKKQLFHKSLGHARELSVNVTALCFLPVKGDLPRQFTGFCETSLTTKLTRF